MDYFKLDERQKTKDKRLVSSENSIVHCLLSSVSCLLLMKNIVVTGAAGFIGSCLVGHLNQLGYDNIIVVDDFSKKEKLKLLSHRLPLMQH